jgi:hypothetical protein
MQENAMRFPLVLLALVLVGDTIPDRASSPATSPGFRIVFRYRRQGPASVKDYESQVQVFERVAGGGEKLIGTFSGSIFPDDMSKWGRIKDGTYPLYLGLHHRSRDGKALTPTPKDLEVKTQGWLRPALIVNADKPVPVLSDNPKKKTSRYIHLHNGYKTKRWSEGCLTIPPAEWERFITIFLNRYRQLDDWHQQGRYYGRLVAVLEVMPLPEPPRSGGVK